jgi:hypothetical protein
MPLIRRATRIARHSRVNSSSSVGVPLKTAIPGQKGYQIYLQLAASL